jgi:hypothetical protein
VFLPCQCKPSCTLLLFCFPLSVLSIWYYLGSSDKWGCLRQVVPEQRFHSSNTERLWFSSPYWRRDITSVKLFNGPSHKTAITRKSGSLLLFVFFRTWKLSDIFILCVTVPITVAARSKAWTVFARSNADRGVESYSRHGCLCAFILFVLFCV